MTSAFSSSGLAAFILESNAVLAACAVLYLLCLQKLTHHAWQRGFLLLAIFSSLAIALVQYDIETVVYQSAVAAMTDLPTLAALPADVGEESNTAPTSLGDRLTVIFQQPTELISMVFWGGFALFLLRFFVLLFALFAHTGRATSFGKGIFLSSRFSSAFAFFNRVYLPTHFLKLDQRDLDFVIQHEKAHVHFRHSFDSVLLELLKSVFWYNPLYWWVQAEMKRVHEFQVDASLTSRGLEDCYSELLVKLTSHQAAQNLIEPFSMHSLKQRIQRMHQPKSLPMKKVVFLLFVPLVASFIYAFSIRHTERIVLVSPEPDSLAIKPSALQFVLPIAPKHITRTSSFGWREHPISTQRKHHNGLDLVAPLGTEIMAAAGGKVSTVTADDSPFGIQVIIEHQNGFTTRYAHLNQTLVAEGAQVNAGDAIALCGSTGESTGPHLHFEIAKNGSQVNPEAFLPALTDARKMNIDKSAFTVILDPGHGGKDPGTELEGLIEKQLCLDYSLALKTALEARDFRVVTTRSGDEFISLTDRVQMTETTEEMILLSLHFNANEGPNGIETFISNADNAHLVKSQQLAEAINRQLGTSSLTNLGTKSAGFYILKNAQCPVVMLELGSIATEADREGITSEEYKKEVVATIVQGIEGYCH